MAVPAGVWRAAFSSRLTKTCSRRTLSSGTIGRSSGMSVVTLRPARSFSTRSKEEPTSSSMECGSLRSWTVPDVRRVVSMRLWTSRDEPFPFLLDVLQELALLAARQRAALEQAAGRADDGRQGRAQVMGHRTQERTAQALLLGVQLGLLGVVLQAVDLERQGQLVREGLQQEHLVRDQEPLAHAGLHAQDPHRSLPRR